MSPAVLAPPIANAPSIGPRPYRWTISEYRELETTGRFHDVKTMLIDGAIFVVPRSDPLRMVNISSVPMTSPR